MCTGKNNRYCKSTLIAIGHRGRKGVGAGMLLFETRGRVDLSQGIDPFHLIVGARLLMKCPMVTPDVKLETQGQVWDYCGLNICQRAPCLILDGIRVPQLNGYVWPFKLLYIIYYII